MRVLPGKRDVPGATRCAVLSHATIAASRQLDRRAPVPVSRAGGLKAPLGRWGAAFRRVVRHTATGDAGAGLDAM